VGIQAVLWVYAHCGDGYKLTVAGGVLKGWAYRLCCGYMLTVAGGVLKEAGTA